MRCVVCGDEGRERDCCEDRPVFCDSCNDIHQGAAHSKRRPEEELEEAPGE